MAIDWNKHLKYNITWTLEVAVNKVTLDAFHSPSQGGVSPNETGISLGIKTNFVETMETIGRILWNKIIIGKWETSRNLFLVEKNAAVNF